MISPSQRYGWMFTAGRLGLFLICAALLYVLGFRSILLLAGALILSVPLSFVLLRPIRLKWSAEIEQNLERRREAKQKLRSALRGDE